jgi:hypothetical protein
MNLFFRLYKKKRYIYKKKRYNNIAKKKPKKKPNNKKNKLKVDNASKIALLIGINYYINNYTEQQLFGCINDVKRVKKLLLDRGFLEKNIMYMTDGKETPTTSKLFPNKQNILDRINNLFMRQVVDSNGNIIYTTRNINGILYYSGHGSNVIINSPIKLDTQYNQVDYIVPYDYDSNNSNNSNNLISDIEIKDILNNNTSKPFKTSMFFDSCVNQTICNLAYGYFSTLNNKKQYPYQQTKNNITRYTNVNVINHCQVFQMSGSTEKQNSVNLNDNVTLNGAYTMAFLNCFKPPDLYKIYTWKDFLMCQRKFLLDKKFIQIPQLSSARLSNINTEIINF